MILSCVICDDMQTEAELTKQRVLKAYQNCDFTCEASICTKGHHLLSIIESKRNLHLLILDIEMPDISGIEIAKALKELGKQCLVIFLTSHNEYAIDGYELGVFRFPASVLIPRRRLLRVKWQEMPASTISTPTKPSRKASMPAERKNA